MMLTCYRIRLQTTFHQELSTFFPTGFPIGMGEVWLSHLLAQGEGIHPEASDNLIKKPFQCSWWDALT